MLRLLALLATPVANPPAVNRVKAGFPVLVRFSLTGNQTLAILDGTPVSMPVSCSSEAPVSDIQGAPPAASSGLYYVAALDQYVYIWKTDRAWARTCRQLVIKLADGTIHRANFSLVK